MVKSYMGLERFSWKMFKNFSGVIEWAGTRVWNSGAAVPAVLTGGSPVKERSGGGPGKAITGETPVNQGETTAPLPDYESCDESVAATFERHQ